MLYKICFHTSYHLYFLISGRCLFFNEELYVVDLYRCHTFANRCPNLEIFAQKIDERMYQC